MLDSCRLIRFANILSQGSRMDKKSVKSDKTFSLVAPVRLAGLSLCVWMCSVGFREEAEALPCAWRTAPCVIRKQQRCRIFVDRRRKCANIQATAHPENWYITAFRGASAPLSIAGLICSVRRAGALSKIDYGLYRAERRVASRKLQKLKLVAEIRHVTNLSSYYSDMNNILFSKDL